MTSKRSLCVTYLLPRGRMQAIFATDSQKFESINQIKGLRGDPHFLIRHVEGLIPAADDLIQETGGLLQKAGAQAKLHKLRIFGVA